MSFSKCYKSKVKLEYTLTPCFSQHPHDEHIFIFLVNLCFVLIHELSDDYTLKTILQQLLCCKLHLTQPEFSGEFAWWAFVNWMLMFYADAHFAPPMYIWPKVWIIRKGLELYGNSHLFPSLSVSLGLSFPHHPPLNLHSLSLLLSHCFSPALSQY